MPYQYWPSFSARRDDCGDDVEKPREKVSCPKTLAEIALEYLGRAFVAFVLAMIFGGVALLSSAFFVWCYSLLKEAVLKATGIS